MATSETTPSCSECLWCADTQFMQCHLHKYLKSFDTELGTIINDSWIEQATRSLSRCMDCVEVYHQLVEEAFNIDPRFKTKRSYFVELVNKGNTDRLREYFCSALENIKTDCTEEDEQQYSQLSQYRGHTLDCPIRELLKFPKLLMSHELNDQLATAIEQLEEIDQLPQINDKYPGLYLLLVHPNQKVCSWAVRTVKSLGSLDWDDYDEMEEVINWMMAVISFNLFLNDDDCAEIAEQRRNQTILPKHLFVHRSPKEFWIGICMLIKAMDGGCIRSRLMSVNGHRELVDTVLLNLTVNADKNYTSRVDKARCTHTHPTVQSASTTVFWPAMQCYSILLDKLGSRFWQHTSKDASVVLSDIFSNPYYCFELTQWATLNSDMEDTTSLESDSELVSNSQVVQDWKPSLRPQEVIQLTQTVADDLDYETEEENAYTATAHRKSRTSVFSWISPFINSILDFGEGGYPNIKCLVQVVHAIFVGAMSGKNHFEFICDGKWSVNLNITASPSITAARAYDILSYSAFANEAFLALVNLVDLLVTKSFFTPLICSQNSWLDDIVLGAKALIHSACSYDGLIGKVAHPTSLQQLARVMVELLTTKYARGDTELCEVLSFCRSSTLTKKCSPAASGPKTLLMKFATGNFLRNKLVDIVKHCESTTLDDFQISKDTAKSSSCISKCITSSREESPPIFEEQEISIPPKQEKHSLGSDDSDTDRTPDLFSDGESNVKQAFRSYVQTFRSNVKKENDSFAISDNKTNPKDYTAESSTDDCESPQHLREGTSKNVVRDNLKSSTHQVCNTSLSRATLSRSRDISTEKKLIQTTLITQGSQLSASSEASAIGGDQQLSSSKMISSSHNYATAVSTKETPSIQFRIKEKVEVAPSLPIHAELQHKSVPNSSHEVILISDSEETNEEPKGVPSGVVQSDSPCNVRHHEVCIASMTSNDPPARPVQSQSSSLHGAVKSYSLDSEDSMCEGLSELKKMVDPARQSVIDLRDGDESRPDQSSSDSDDDAIPVMERFANMTNPVTEQSGNASKQAVESDSDESVHMYRRCKKASFLSLSEEGSGSEESDSESSLASGVVPKLYRLPVCGTVSSKQILPMRDCKVVVRKCCNVRDRKFSSGINAEAEKVSPCPMDISDSDISNCSMEKIEKSTNIDTEAFLPAVTSDVMSPCPMDISDSDLPEEPIANLVSKKAVEKGESKGQVIENQHMLRRWYNEDTTNQCHPDSSHSVLSARSAVCSPLVPNTADHSHSLQPLVGRQMPVATVTPMGFPAMASDCTAKNAESSQELPKRKQLLPARKLPSNRRKVPTFENCQAQFLPGPFKNPNDYSCAVERSTDLLSTIMPCSSNTRQVPKGGATPAVSVKPAASPASISVNRVIIKPKVPFRMNDFHIRVLSWDPQWFLYPQESEDRQLMCPSPAWFPPTLSVPLVFHSVDQYCEVFSPLLLIEVWEEVYNGTQGKSSPIPPLPPPCVMKVEAVCAADHPLLQIIKCKTKLPLELGKQYAHPVQQHLIRVEHGAGAHLFAYVDSYTRILQHLPPNHDPRSPTSSGSNPGSYFELTLCLRVCKLDFAHSSSLENREIRCTTVASLADHVRKWNGLVNLHTSPLAANILSPLGGVYFGGGKQPPSDPLRNEVIQMLGNQYNDSQKNAVLAAVQATQAGFVHPRICLLQGPPGTGKTHTIIGLIRALFKVLRSQQLPGCSLPGQRFGGLPQTAPHILLCAPSNTAVDEVVKRLIRKGHVRNTKEWRERYKEQLLPNATERASLPGLNVIRVGQDVKIDALVKPISLDELARKDLFEEKSVIPQLDQLRKEIGVLEKEVESLENELHLAKKHNTEKVSGLEQALNQKQERKNNLIKQHRDARMKQKNSHREESMVRKRLLMNADIICSTLCGSGSSVMECFLRNPLHFSCVIVDEASQCCELDMLIPLRYQSSKLILIGDPLQLSATVKSQIAQEHGLGQSLFERLYNHFSQMNDEENPVKMLQIQYRMLPQICQFPSQHFYKGKLLSARDMNTEFPFKPFLVFDVAIGQEESKDEGSIFNVTEAALVLNLCKVLLKSINCSQIGIITPYKAQERLIKSELKEKHVGQQIDVGTVDGYQGKEKDVTILSCVRAKNTSGSIGFLWNRQRMNVSLTRGRKGLYILCHVESLKVSPDWSALIQNAVDRKVIVPVNNNNLGTVAQDVAKPPPPNTTDQRSSGSEPPVRTLPAPAKPEQACASSTATTKRASSSTDGGTVSAKVSTQRGKSDPPRDPRNPSKYRNDAICTAVVNPLPRGTLDPPVDTPSAAPKISSARHYHRPHGSAFAEMKGDGKSDTCTDQRRDYPGGVKRTADGEGSVEAKKAKQERYQKGDESSTSEADKWSCSAAGTSSFPSPRGSTTPDTRLAPSGDIAWRPHGGERPRTAHPNAAVVPRRQPPTIETSVVPKRRLSAREEIERRANRRGWKPSL